MIGDPCYFNVHADDPYINGRNWYGDEYDSEEDLDYNSWVEEREQYREVYRAITKFLSIFSEDSLERMFGDSSRVIVRRGQEPEVENYYD